MCHFLDPSTERPLTEAARAFWSHLSYILEAKGHWLVATAALFVTAVLNALILMGWSRLPRLYRIAMLGFPRAGKTSLICAIVDYIRKAESKGGRAVIRSEETERRLTANIKSILDGDGPLPTTDNEVFAYRVDVRVPLTVFGLSVPGLNFWYKIEIGDFPGDDTVKFAEEFGDTLHATPYFGWALDSNAYIFAIDCGKSFGENSGDYISRQSSAFTEAWSRIRLYHFDNKLPMKRAPLVVVFTKADAGLKEMPTALGLGDLHHLEEKLAESFKTMISRLNKESSKFDWEIESLFLEERNRAERWVGRMVEGAQRVPELSQCLGIGRIANLVLPREIASQTHNIQ